MLSRKSTSTRLLDICIVILAANLIRTLGALNAPTDPTLLPFVYTTASERFAVTGDGKVIKDPIILVEPDPTDHIQLEEGTYFAADDQGCWQYRVDVSHTGHVNYIKIPPPSP